MNLSQDAFIPGASKFQQYLLELMSLNDFSGTKLLEIMATFQEPLQQHMRSEVSTIADLAYHQRTPKEGSAEEKSIQAAFDKREGNNLLMSGVMDVLPFFLFNFDRDYEDGLWKDWPPVLGLVRWVLIRIANVLHPGWWNFASCDTVGRRRALHAVSDA